MALKGNIYLGLDGVAPSAAYVREIQEKFGTGGALGKTAAADPFLAQANDLLAKIAAALDPKAEPLAKVAAPLSPLERVEAAFDALAKAVAGFDDLGHRLAAVEADR